MAETAALAAVAVSAVAAAGTAVYSGQQAKAAAEAEAAQYAEEQDAARTAAAQEEAAKDRQLRSVLATSEALRSARGLDLMSPTGEAIRRESVDNATADVTTIRANANRRTRRLGLGADATLDRGSAAVVGSYGQAVGSLAGGASSAYGIASRGGLV